MAYRSREKHYIANLKQLREEHLIKQEELCMEVGISRQSISKIEHGAATRKKTKEAILLAINKLSSIKEEE